MPTPNDTSRTPHTISRSLATALLLLLCARSASAQIGETESQIAKRYGKPIGHQVIAQFGDTKTYKAPGFEIAVVLKNGICTFAAIKKSGNSKLEEFEIGRVLQNNSGNSRWAVDPLASFYTHAQFREYRRTDNHLVAFVLPDTVMVMTSQTADEMKAGKRKKK